MSGQHGKCFKDHNQDNKEFHVLNSFAFDNLTFGNHDAAVGVPAQNQFS